MAGGRATSKLAETGESGHIAVEEHVSLDPRLLEILACPDTHHAPLTLDEAAQELTCTECGRVYPIRDGIPVLLLDEALPKKDV